MYESLNLALLYQNRQINIELRDVIKKHINYSWSDYDQLQEAEEDELLDYQTLKSAIFDPQVLERL